MRVGLLCGTFNPIHEGHLQVAEAVLKKLLLEKVLFIPSGNPPHKNDQAIPAAFHRLEMTRLALINHSRFEASDIEIRRPGRSYSIDTILELNSRYPHDRFFFIVGIDAFSEIATWREPDRLLGLCDFVIVSRQDFPFLEFSCRASLPGLDLISLRQLDDGIKSAYIYPTESGTKLHFIRIPPCPISASEIRKKIKAQKETKNILPDSVKSYIIQRGLY